MATVVQTGAGTTVVSGGESKGNKPVSIILIILGALGILLGIFSIIYAATGLSIALEGTGVEALQASCKDSFAANGGDTGRCDADADISNALSDSHIRMCGLQQEDVGCSYSAFKGGFELAQGVGLGATIAGSFFVIIASIPVLANGVHGFMGNEVAAKVSGGFGVGCSIPGLLGAGICTIVLLIGTLAGHVANALIKDHHYVESTTTTPAAVWGGQEQIENYCSDACRESIDATSDLGVHIIGYYETLSLLMFILVILAFVESIFACISCCFWKKQSITVITTAPVVAPVAVVAPVVAAPAAQVKVEEK